MKNIVIKLQIVLLLLIAINAQAQLPLKYGDGVITHSNNYGWNTGGNEPLIRVIHTSNTLSAPLNAPWLAPAKPNNNYYSNWDKTHLGLVFGISLDENPPPNIYVSSTQIFSGSGNNQRKVYRLNGSSGAESLVFDYNNISGTGTATSLNSLGNLKYLKTPTTENIYLTDFETGEIHRLTGVSTSTGLWTNQSAFNPKFKDTTDNPNELPYGLAIRKLPTGTKLYYAKIYRTPIGSVFGSNMIYCVDLNADGSFNTSSEQYVFTINTSAILHIENQPISDMAFGDDGKKLIIGQQTWYGSFASLDAHHSNVLEFVDNTLTNSFTPSLHIFESGTFSLKTNSSGGVSYSNNIIKDSVSFGCDTSVYFTSDAIDRSNAMMDIYGVMGYAATGGTCANAIWIDGDDNIVGDDKEKQGDVEIYKKPNVCNVVTPCQCGAWDSISLNNQGHWWVPPTVASGSPIPTLSFNQGAVSGVLIPHYRCSGTNCNATFTYTIASHGGTPTPLSSGGGVLDLNQSALNKLPCGHYTLCIKPRCGSTDCPPQCIPFEIICLPLCACKGNVTVNANQQSWVVTAQNNIATANPVSTVSGSFTVTSSMPATEVRMVIDEFRVITKTGNENCRLCKNKPQSWGSINSARLSGVALQTFITPTLTNDIREFVFNNGPSTVFNLNSAPLNFSIALPGITGLDCCNLQIEMCVKIIVRDNNCCETEILKCGLFDLK